MGMKMHAEQLENFACRLEYPLDGSEPGIAMQEVYTSTFDLNPACHLYAGFALFGESYKRGALLVELKQMLIREGVGMGAELPDFIPTLLRLLARLPQDEEDSRELKEYCLNPAIAKILEDFQNHENPYYGILGELRDFLQHKEGLT